MEKRFEDFLPNGKSCCITTDWQNLNVGSFIITASNESKMWLQYLLSFEKAKQEVQSVWINAFSNRNLPIKKYISILPQPSINSILYEFHSPGSYHDMERPSQWKRGHLMAHMCGLSQDQRMRILLSDAIWNNIIGWSGSKTTSVYKTLKYFNCSIR